MAREAKTRGRGRLSSIELLPPECDGLIVWAAQELAGRDRSQTDIYAEFVAGCEALMAEHRGELEFTIPSFSAFNRYSVRQARLTRRLAESRELAAALAQTFSYKEADELTVMTGETVKSIILHMLADLEEDKLDPKDLMHLASAFHKATQAQSVSSERRRRGEKEFAERVDEAVNTVVKAKGLTAETAEAIKAQILGVTA